MARQKICIISFSLIRRDARILRQIKYLIPHYDLAVIGLGGVPDSWKDDSRLEWRELRCFPISTAGQIGQENRREAWLRRGHKAARLIWQRRWGEFFNDCGIVLRPRIIYRLQYIERLLPWTYEKWYWRRPIFQNAYRLAVSGKSDAFYANDWNALPVAAQAAEKMGARLIFDAHEYAPLEKGALIWRLFNAPTISHFIRKYVPRLDGSVTVSPGIAKKYNHVFGFEPLLVRNVPETASIAGHEVNPEKIRIIHHGGAVRLRRLEDFIEIIRLTDRRFELNYMLTGDPNYVSKLKMLSKKRAPGRVFFHDPVAPEEVVNEIGRYDMSLCFKKPLCFNEKYSLPNKFFDSIAAGLAILAGPSPEMNKIIGEYGLGLVFSDFSLKTAAKEISALKVREIEDMRMASVRAARDINAERELSKLVKMIKPIMEKPPSYSTKKENRCVASPQ